MIGVILMVAITVVLAAVVTTFVLAESDKLDNTNKLVSLQSSATSDTVTVELVGGGGPRRTHETEVLVRLGISL